MKKLLAMLILLAAFVERGMAQDWKADEDRSRFTERSYPKAEPGMLPPGAYIEMAKKAVHSKSNDIHFRAFSNGIVTHRIYRNAPPADRDIVCVSFVYEGDLGGGGTISGEFIDMKANLATPVLQALIRKDGSKIYLNFVDYKVR